MRKTAIPSADRVYVQQLSPFQRVPIPFERVTYSLYISIDNMRPSVLPLPMKLAPQPFRRDAPAKRAPAGTCHRSDSQVRLRSSVRRQACAHVAAFAPPILALCFHILTNCFSRKSFVLITIRITPGVWGIAPSCCSPSGVDRAKHSLSRACSLLPLFFRLPAFGFNHLQPLFPKHREYGVQP
jgi:hypothetical protein